MAKYITINSEGYGQSVIEMTEEVYDVLTDKSSIIPDSIYNSTLEDYEWRKWDSNQKLWIDDLAKKAELYLERNPPIPEPDPIIPPELTLEEKKSIELSKILSARIEKQSLGCSWNSHIVDCSMDSITLLNSAVLMTNLNLWNNGSWKMTDGTYVTLSNEQVINLATTIGTYVQGLYARESELRSLINSAIDESGLTWSW